MTPFTDLTKSELLLFSEVLFKLGASACCGKTLRAAVLGDITRLLRADFGSSYVWDAGKHASRDGVTWNIAPAVSAAYDNQWQYQENLTTVLRQRQVATTVSEVMPRQRFINTAFYGDYLRPNDMADGINIFFVRDGHDIGDLRLWRAHDQPLFGEREKHLLATLQYYFLRSLPGEADSEQQLTLREQEVVNLISKGMNDKEVARLLDIGFTTVRSHIKNALRKSGSANRAELAARYGHHHSQWQ